MKVRRADGELNEEELTVRIYDAEKLKKTAKLQNIGILIGALIFCLIFLALMAVFFIQVKH